MKKSISFFGMLLFCSTQFLFAQSGALDLTFNTTGKIQEDFNGGFDQGNALAVQSDGKTIAVGSSYDGSFTNFALARYLSNGTLDNSFGSFGKEISTISNYANGATDVAIQPDGKLVVVGYAGTVGGTNNFVVARYLTNGVLDYSFGTNGVVSTDLNTYNDVARSVAIQPDGKILVGGYTQIVANGALNFGIVRYTATGSLDATFGSGGKKTINYVGQGDFLKRLLLLPNGNFLAAGYFTSSGIKHIGIIGFYSNGTPNINFGMNGKLDLDFRALYNSEASDIALQSNGKVIVVGAVENAIQPYYNFAALRIDTTGVIDPTFANNGKYEFDFGIESRAYSVALQSDGKIVIGGRTINSSTIADFRIIRLNSNGTLNTIFGNNGIVATSFNGQQSEFNKMKIGVDGNIVAVGSVGVSANDFGLARYITTSLVAPNLLSPSNNTINVSISPTLDWSDVPTAMNYTVQVSTDSTFTTWTVKQNTTASTFSAYNLVAGQKYFWHTRAFVASDTSAWSAVWSFTTMPIPSNVTLLSPTKTSTNVSLTPSFSWNNTALATHYELQVSTSNTFASTVIVQPTLSVSNYTVTTSLNNNTTYYWRVRASNSSGIGTWSAAWSFTTIPIVPPIPSVPTLLLPANNASNVIISPTFDWNDASATNTYHIQVSTNNAFTNFLVNDSSSALSSFSPSFTLSVNTTYFWRVRAKGTGGISGWSNVWSFKTENPNDIAQNEKKYSIQIYPNPFSDFIQIETEVENATAILYDIQGREIMQKIFSNTTKISTQDLSAGMYIIKLQTDNGNLSKQIIKTK